MTITNTDRADQFKGDIAKMKLKTGTEGKEGALQLLGALLMVAGIVVAFIAWRASLNITPSKVGSNSDLLDGNSYSNFAITGLAVTVTGAALFLRYSLAKFLRVWLLRQMYEGQSHIDQVVEAIGRR